MRYFFSLIFFLGSLELGVYGQSKSELENRRNSILKEIDETENILNDTKQSKTESIENLELLDKKIKLRNSVIDNLILESKNTDQRITELEKVTASLADDISNIKKEYGHMIYLAYLNRQQNSDLMFILASSSFNQAYKRILYLKQYSVYRKRQVDLINSVQKELLVQMGKLADERQEKLKLVKINRAENDELQDEVTEKAQLVNRLKEKEKELIRKLNQKNRIAERLNKEIEDIVRSELKRRTSKVSGKSAVVLNKYENALGNNFQENKGKLPWPIDKGIVTSTFGEHPHPVYKGVTVRNNGIDISTNEGEVVKSIFSGEVKAVLFILGSNYSVIIRHGNFLSVYQNLISVRVKVGDRVKTNQVLGEVFTDADTKSTVLHLEIWDELKKLNPEIWLSPR